MAANPSPFTRSNPARAITLLSPRDNRVALGPMLPDDLGAMFLWLNDADAALTDYAHRPMDTMAFKAWLDGMAQQNSQILFVIRTVADPRALGFVVFKNLQPSYRSAELGIRIGAEQDRGRGYGVRAVRLALAYGWDTLNLHRVSLAVFANNPRAIAAYRKAGFCEEGIMRHAAFTGGVWHDVMLMAALNPREAKGPDVSAPGPLR